jgi:hypothetical protein
MSDQAISPLRRRMIEDMTIRKLTPDTQRGYIRTNRRSLPPAVRELASNSRFGEISRPDAPYSFKAKRWRERCWKNSKNLPCAGT